MGSRLMKDRNTRKADKKAKASLSWPVKPEEGVTVMHIEWDEEPRPSSDLNQKPLSRIEKLFQASFIRFGPKIRLIANHKKALKEYSPTGTFRSHSFEVINVNTKQRIYSMLQTGANPVDTDASLNFLL